MDNGEYKAEFIDLLYDTNWIEQPNYTACVRGNKIFLAYMDKLYEYKNGKVKKKPFPLPVFNGWVLSYCITRIEFCEENPDYLLLYVKTAKVSGEPDTYENAIFIYNIKTGRKSYFARPVENEFLFSSYAE